jgi:hypothetical protein
MGGGVGSCIIMKTQDHHPPRGGGSSILAKTQDPPPPRSQWKFKTPNHPPHRFAPAKKTPNHPPLFSRRPVHFKIKALCNSIEFVAAGGFRAVPTPPLDLSSGHRYTTERQNGIAARRGPIGIIAPAAANGIARRGM